MIGVQVTTSHVMAVDMAHATEDSLMLVCLPMARASHGDSIPQWGVPSQWLMVYYCEVEFTINEHIMIHSSVTMTEIRQANMS